MTLQSDTRPTTDDEPLRGIGAGPVDPIAPTRLRPLPAQAVTLAGGLLGDLQRDNGAVSIPRGDAHLTDEGAWTNYEHAAAGDVGEEYFGPVFEDGEVYKWLEAVAWQAGRGDDPRLEEWLARYSALIASAQADDGYLSTFVQAAGKRDRRYGQLEWDHEVFNMGAMIQAAVAQYRTTGRIALLDVARRAADHLDRTFGPGRTETSDGHPVIEMALVELYRVTGETRYRDLASFFVEVRGHGTIWKPGEHFGPTYFSDRVPVRETLAPEGHAVRAVYFASGATDVAIETGDAELLALLAAQWTRMVETKAYLTGGLGSRWEGESFGDPYELPSDRAYAETCAAIASLQWSWRLLLATGEAKYADLIERQLYNAVLPGVSLDRDAYFYVNALQVRAGAVVDDPMGRTPANGRQHWFGCSCCPTNLMRTFASVQAYVATRSDTGLQVHQYAAGRIEADGIALETTTDYPFDGRVTVRIAATPGEAWELALRVPAWAEEATASVNGEAVPVTTGDHLRIRRAWREGDVVELVLPTTPRLVAPNPRIDDVRGSVAVLRGPLVYAIEQVDQQAAVDDLAVDVAVPLRETRDADRLDGVPAVVLAGRARGGVPTAYGPAAAESPAVEPVDVIAVPYFMWANREVGPMRVWIPTAG